MYIIEEQIKLTPITYARILWKVKLMLSMVAILISFSSLVGCEKPPTPTPTPEPIPPVVATKESLQNI